MSISEIVGEGGVRNPIFTAAISAVATAAATATSAAETVATTAAATTAAVPLRKGIQRKAEKGLRSSVLLGNVSSS